VLHHETMSKSDHIKIRVNIKTVGWMARGRKMGKDEMYPEIKRKWNSNMSSRRSLM